MKIAITGATGYIGQRLISAALRTGHEVVAFSRRPLKQQNVAWQHYKLSDSAPTVISSDIAAVFHLAANTQQIDLDESVELAAASRLIKEAKAIGATFVFVSSQTAHPKAPTAYGRIKWQIERMTLSSGGRVVRPGQVYGGPARGSFGELYKLVRYLPMLPAFFPSPKVQPVHVDDLALALLASVNQPDSSVLNVAEPVSISFIEFLQSIARGRFRKQLFRIPVPVFLVRSVISLLSLFFVNNPKLVRLESLFSLPQLDTIESIQRLQIKLRPFPAGITRSGRWRRELLMEGYAFMKYVLRVRPENILVRRYVRCIESMSTGQALMLPSILLRYPVILALLDGSKRVNDCFEGEFGWRLNAALLLTEASPQGAMRFLDLNQQHGWLRSFLRMTRAFLSETWRRVLQLLFWPFVTKLIAQIKRYDSSYFSSL